MLALNKTFDQNLISVIVSSKSIHHSGYALFKKKKKTGPAVPINVSLTSSLVVKMLTVLVNTISNSNAKATHILVAKILAHMPYLMSKVLTIL